MRTSRLFRRSLALLALLGCGPWPSLAAAQELETFVLTAGGNSACGTFGFPAPVFTLFGAHGVSEPSPGFAACGVGATQRYTSAVSGILADALVSPRSWGAPLNSEDASCSATARYGVLRSAARSVFNGTQSSSLVAGADGFSIFRDELTITSPSVPAGSVGSLRVRVRVTGSVSTTAGTSDVELTYLLGNSLVFTMFRAQAFHPAAVPFLISGTSGGPFPGFSLSPGRASGSTVVTTFDTPFAFGTPLNFEMRLLAYAVPGGSGDAAADFGARVLEVQVSRFGQPVSDARVASASGAHYGTGPASPQLLPPLVLPTGPLPAPLVVPPVP